MSARSPREVFIDVQGLRLRAVLDGEHRADANALLVLHGFTGSAESMCCVSEPLASHRQVVRLDLVGHGKSDAPKTVAPYEMKACAAQVAASVAALDLGRPHLLGYSMGGRVALTAALAYPDLFSSVVLVGATPGIADPQLRRERIASDEALADRIEENGVAAFVEEWMALPIFASQSRLGAEALACARAQRLQNRPQALAHSLRGMGAGAGEPLHKELEGFAGPVLLVVGEEDAKFRGIAASMEAAMQKARTEVIEAAGHAAHLEAPRAFSIALRRFLEEVDALETRSPRGVGDPA